MAITAIICVLLVLVYSPNGLGIYYGPSIVSLLPKINPDRSRQVDSMLRNVGNIWKNSSRYTSRMSIQEKANDEQTEEFQDNPVKLFLKDYPDFSVVLPIFENRSWATAMEIWRLTFPSSGEKRFSIEAPENHGIVAVIQELDIKVRQGSTCSLYIKFGDSNSTTERICGKIGKNDPTLEPRLLIGPRSFVSSDGKMTVIFNAFPGILGVDSYIRVAIAFTAFKEGCYFNISDTTDFGINPKDYKPCAMRGWQSSCIKSKLFCDNVINCGEKEEFEKDEANCFNNINIEHLIPTRKIIPSQTDLPTLSAETRYILYSHFTSTVIGIIGFFTLFFVIRYMITRTCGGAAKSKPLVERRLQNSSAIAMNLNIEMEERNAGESGTSSSCTEPSFVFANSGAITDTNVGYKLYSLTRSLQDDPPSYFDLFPQAEENCDSRSLSQTQI